jgi:DNA-binding GntR family transcriptional regulator
MSVIMVSTSKKKLNAEDIVSHMMKLFDTKVYQPGDRLREQELADKFKVSRGPVREALRTLEAKSLVKIEPGRGASVMRLSDEDAQESVEISAALFGLCAEKCALSEAPPVEKMKVKLADLKELVSDGSSSKEFFLQTVRIGIVIMIAADSARLTSLLSDTRVGAPDLFGPLGFTTKELRKRALKNWTDMISAIEKGDAVTAGLLGKTVHMDALNAALEIVK